MRLLPLFLLTAMTASAASNQTNWDGFYLGGELGEAWNQSQWTYDNPNYFNTAGPVVLGSHFDSNAHGIIGGGYLGYGHRVEPVILGLEASFLGSDVNTTFNSPFFPTFDDYTIDLQFLATVKGRIAYPLNEWLLFLNGGWAGGSVDLTFQDMVVNDIKADETKWANGWTVGAGLEYQLFEHFALGIAYNYVQLYLNDESISCDACGSGPGFGTPEVDGNMRTQILTGRASYYFK